QPAPGKPGEQGKRQAYRAASDFAAATIVGCLLGYGIDVLAHCSPFGLIGGLVVGVIAGFRMMMRDINPSQGDSN
ncbi:AtpZ/AtpI family protein, partial [Salmonella enterica]